MKAKMRFSLKSGERIFINGAVLTVNQKVTLSLLNDACFLLELHVLQYDDATTPLRQLYFVVQALIIEPKSRSQMVSTFKDLHSALRVNYPDADVSQALKTVREYVEGERFFDALKLIRTLFPVDDEQKARAALGALKAA